MYVTQPQKKDEVSSFVTTWVDPEAAMVSEIRQRKRSTIFFPLCVESNNKMNKYYKTETDSWIERKNKWLPEGRMEGGMKRLQKG